MTRAACPALRVTPLAACSSRVNATDSVAGWAPVRHARGGQEAGLGGEDLRAGEQGGPGDLVHAGPVSAAQLLRFVDAVAGAGQAHRRHGCGLVGDQVDDGLDLGGGQVRGPDLAVGFGAQVPDLPGGAAGLDLVADPHRGGAHPGRIHGHRARGHRLRGAPG